MLKPPLIEIALAKFSLFEELLNNTFPVASSYSTQPRLQISI